jgi:hypothetical protein
MGASTVAGVAKHWRAVGRLVRQRNLGTAALLAIAFVESVVELVDPRPRRPVAYRVIHRPNRPLQPVQPARRAHLPEGWYVIQGMPEGWLN